MTIQRQLKPHLLRQNKLLIGYRLAASITSNFYPSAKHQSRNASSLSSLSTRHSKWPPSIAMRPSTSAHAVQLASKLMPLRAAAFRRFHQVACLGHPQPEILLPKSKVPKSKYFREALLNLNPADLRAEDPSRRERPPPSFKETFEHLERTRGKFTARHVQNMTSIVATFLFLFAIVLLLTGQWLYPLAEDHVGRRRKRGDMPAEGVESEQAKQATDEPAVVRKDERKEENEVRAPPLKQRVYDVLSRVPVLKDLLPPRSS